MSGDGAADGWEGEEEGEEEDLAEIEIVPLDVQKPLFVHGPRLQLAQPSEDQSSKDVVHTCYSHAYDLIFVVTIGGVAVYRGQALVESAGDGSEPITTLPVSTQPLQMRLADEGGFYLAVACLGGSIDFFSLEAAAEGKASKVFCAALDGEEVGELCWKDASTCLCVCGSGRVLLIEPSKSTYTCVHDVVEFAARCVGVERNQELVLIGGGPPGEDANGSNLWALDVTSSDAHPVML
jgi:hypothetical protein